MSAASAAAASGRLHPVRPLTKLGRVLLLRPTCHDSISSEDRVCGHAGDSAWNDNPKPDVWVKTADEILDNVVSYCRRITDSGH